MDVSMNAHGVKVERDLGRPIMSSLHAGWSFGGVVGAGFAAALAALGVDPRITVALASALLLVVVLDLHAAHRRGLGRRGRGRARASRCPRAASSCSRSLCLLVMVTEGAMADWGGLYLRGDLGASAAVAALAFAVFSAGMTTGRVFGDWVTGRIGAGRDAALGRRC